MAKGRWSLMGTLGYFRLLMVVYVHNLPCWSHGNSPGWFFQGRTAAGNRMPRPASRQDRTTIKKRKNAKTSSLLHLLLYLFDIQYIKNEYLAFTFLKIRFNHKKLICQQKCCFTPKFSGIFSEKSGLLSKK